MTLAAGTHLGSYRVVALLGAGGMGEVYRARDPKLGREVAIKVLPESLAKDPEALARFEREARAVAALSHPNILGIYDLGEGDGVSYAVMELLEGETLRDKLKEGTPLPQRKAIEYAREIARGLSAAHEKGIVHRDLKPENVFITDDERVKILDFGLAKRTGKASSSGDETSAPTQSTRTEPGTVMGTVGYMAPEQVRGLAVDHRADIFALGAILYELLTGKRAFKGPTPTDTLSAILRDEPPELSLPDSGIPAGLERILRHCLEKSPEARAHSAHDLAFELETLASASGAPTERAAPAAPIAAPPRLRGRVAVLGIGAAVIGAVVLGAILTSRRPRASTSAPSPGVKRLAVLPFENLGPKDDDYFADGITDEVRGKLTNVAGLTVIARASSNGYRRTQKTPQEIGRELNVEYLLTGTVRFAKDGGTRRVQVSPELAETASAASRWAQPFDATVTDVWSVQGEIATRVAQALDVALSTGEKRTLETKPTRNLAAYEAYLRGTEAWQGMAAIDPQSLRRAAGYFEEAVALDSGFLEAWARVSGAASILYANGTPTPAGAARSKEAAEKALALGPERPEGHAALGQYYRFILQDYARALSEMERARTLSPGDAEYVTSTANVELYLGRWEAALGHFEEARRLDPRSARILVNTGNALLRLGRSSEARSTLDAALGLVPTNVAALEWKAMTFLQEGDLAGARAVLKAAPSEVETALVALVVRFQHLVWVLDEPQQDLLLRLTPGAFDDNRGAWALSLAQGYAERHDEPNARKYAEIARAAIVERLAALPDSRRHASVALALSLAYLGRKAEAVREGEKAVEQLPVSKDAMVGPYNLHQLARVYVLTGEPEKAIDALEEMMKVPYHVTKGWLRIDPTFDPLRGSPRFQRLVAGG